MIAAQRRILVIGGGGFLGQHVLASLLERGFSVSSLDLHDPGGFPEVDWLIGSAGDESLVAAAADFHETVVFLASNSLPGSGNADLSAEIGSHLRLAVKTAELCCNQGVKTFIFASSGGAVYGAGADVTREDAPTHPMSAYGVSKLAIEKYLAVLSHLRGMRCLSLRISNPYGPGQRANRNQGFVAAAMSAAIHGTPLTCWGDGSTVRDFIYVKDVADAFVRGCNYKGASQVINIGSGQGRSLVEAIAAVERATGRRIEAHFERGRVFDVPRNVLDSSLAASTLFWTPRHSFEEGLAVTAHWWSHGEPLSYIDRSAS